MTSVFQYLNRKDIMAEIARDQRGRGRGVDNSGRHALNATLSISDKQHKELLDALMNIMYPNTRTRSRLLDRYNRISRDLAAYQANTGLEQQLEKMRSLDLAVSIPDQRYPLAQGYIDEIVTHLLQLLFPARRMYGPTVLDPALQNEAASFAEIINRHALQFSHYKMYGRMLYDAIAYNSGGLSLEWTNKIGWKAEQGTEFGLTGANQILSAGNKLNYLDLYNTIWDYSCAPDEYSYNAQLMATVKPVTEYQLKLMFMRGALFGKKDLQDQLRAVTWIDGKPELAERNRQLFYSDYNANLGLNETASWTKLNTGLYESRPPVRSKWFYVRDIYAQPHHDTDFDADRYLRNECEHGDEYQMEVEHPYANELLELTCRIVPYDYGLGPSRDMQIWKFTILNGNWIVFAQQTATAHGLMPATRCVPKTENGNLQSKSIGEKLTPFQDLISSISNLYLKGMRKNTNNGLIFYDQSRVKLNEHRDPTSGYVPVDRGNDAANKREPLSHLIHTVHERPEINTSMNDIGQVHQLMQDVMPTDMLQTMSSLNRATEHQSQTVSNAASRRLYRLARDTSDDAIAPMLHMMTMNTVQLQEPFEINTGNGQSVLVDPKQFADSGIELGMSDGLRGIDQVAIQQTLGSIIQYVLQSREANKQIDVVKLMEYLLHMQGAAIDIEKFRFETPFDQMDEDQKMMAFQLLQQALQASDAQNGPATQPTTG